jgi:hypothetical protein
MTDRSPATDAEALHLPAVSAEHVQRVLDAAGPALLPAIAALSSALGFSIVRCVTLRARKHVLAGVHLAIARALMLHGQARGQG